MGTWHVQVACRNLCGALTYTPTFKQTKLPQMTVTANDAAASRINFPVHLLL